MKFIQIILLSFPLVLFSCDIKKNKDVKPEEEFLKIYDNQSFSDSYIPVDIQQTSDEGYLILSRVRITESPFYGVYLMKTDKEGKFTNELKLYGDFVNPVGSLMKVGNDYYFFCMNGLTLETKLMRVTEAFNVIEVSQLSIIYPLSTMYDKQSGAFVLQHYDRDNKKTILSRISAAGMIIDSMEFDIGVGTFDVEEPIIDHLTGNGKQLPFLCGTLNNGTYYFNGFYNYTLSLVFFSFGSAAAPGVLQGYRDERCISSVLFYSNNKFALSGFAYGNNTVYPRTDVDFSAGAVASSSDLTGFPVPEFNYDARVVSKKESYKGKEVLIFGSDTKSGQIALYIYDAASGNFIASRHLGYSNTFQIGSFVKTADEGIAVAGVTYLSGRFPRICLFKISKEDIEYLVQ